jgi:putative colanic acid biosynthesis glycosyltransferase
MISLISITLNNLSGLKKTYESIKKQTHQDFEWIILDGGSIDETKTWVKTLHHPALSFHSQPDKGIYDAMNKGIERAKGEYLLFLNAGDQLAQSDTLESLQSIINMAGAPDFIYGDALEEVGDTNKLFLKKARVHQTLYKGMVTHHQAMLYKRKTLGDMRYNLDYTLAADYDFTCRFLKISQNIHYCSFAICIFEAGGTSQNNAAISRKEEYHIKRTLKLCSLTSARAIYLRQTIALAIRMHLPWLYKTMKSF